MTIELQSVTFRSEDPQGDAQFWSRALGWPIVWDESEETAIQSPAGATKIAWNGEPVNAKTARERQYFVVSVPSAHLGDEVGRLLALGLPVKPPAERV